MANASDPRVDARTGTPTTGHEWDGIAELNTPLPRWWLWTFYLCIIWSIAYWIVYPAWPGITGWTAGVWGWNSRTAVVQDLQELKTMRAAGEAKLSAAKLEDIEKNPELLSIARAQGAAAFANNCAPCHGAGAQGAVGYPNLNDDEWLWGGKLADIQTTLQHGIRWDADKDTRSGAMPAFGKDGTLKADEIKNVAQYVRSLSGLPNEGGADLAKGKKVFADNCAACHGDDGKGNQELGAPNLTDKIWLYGSTTAAIENRVTVGGGGQMPAWGDRLDPTTIKALTVYVHSLGGGK
ncbi:MAG TPA: cytochrome-c oxidase, cbb3-type subunit III [Beijerinckiaceae bacterium]|nr:cytochrome-c oxidase, cbb3-type subunit III [Beijerinckiaceae bacterium]